MYYIFHDAGRLTGWDKVALACMVFLGALSVIFTFGGYIGIAYFLYKIACQKYKEGDPMRIIACIPVLNMLVLADLIQSKDEQWKWKMAIPYVVCMVTSLLTLQATSLIWSLVDAVGLIGSTIIAYLVSYQYFRQVFTVDGKERKGVNILMAALFALTPFVGMFILGSCWKIEQKSKKDA